MSTLTLQEQKKKMIYFTLAVVATLIGPLVYVKVAALYHVVLIGLLLLWMMRGIRLAEYNTTLVKFCFLWLGWAALSCVWAPNKAMAAQYVYYIFLITVLCLLLRWLVDNNNLHVVLRVLVLVLFACNVIAVWETVTGDHLVKGYLDLPIRLRLLEFVPGGFYRNPNDFATYIIQLIPFSFAGMYDKNRIIRVVAQSNIFLSLFSVFATQSRTQLIVLLLMFVFFIVFSKKASLIRLLVISAIAVYVVSLFYPNLQELTQNAFESITTEAIQYSAEEGHSLGTRINALYNGMYMLRDYLGIGVGAGCHRALMMEYSYQYYSTGHIIVMHNFLGEMFVDYGVLVGFFFIYTILRLCKRLYGLYKRCTEDKWRILAIMLLFTTATFTISGLSSSSLIQLTSIWTVFCLTDTIAMLSPDGEQAPPEKKEFRVMSFVKRTT